MDLQVRKYWERIFKRKSHYKNVFSGASGDVVLADLRDFCKYGKPPLQLDGNNSTDMYATGMIAGRQEVFYRIISNLHLEDEQIMSIKTMIAEE